MAAREGCTWTVSTLVREEPSYKIPMQVMISSSETRVRSSSAIWLLSLHHMKLVWLHSNTVLEGRKNHAVLCSLHDARAPLLLCSPSNPRKPMQVLAVIKNNFRLLARHLCVATGNINFAEHIRDHQLCAVTAQDIDFRVLIEILIHLSGYD
jgi:hypothetical protein